LDKFQAILVLIREFCEDSPERCLVCGFCTLAEGLAINIRQLRLLVTKCKSWINGSFQRMGWLGLSLKDAMLDEFLSKVPSLRANFSELREWSVRVGKFSQEPLVPTPPPSLGEIPSIPPPPRPSENPWSGADDFAPTFFHGGWDADF
jgi:hypothetical protein